MYHRPFCRAWPTTESVELISMIVKPIRSILKNMSKTTIPVSESTRDLVKYKKRGGQTYDDLLRAVFKEYDPDESHQ